MIQERKRLNWEQSLKGLLVAVAGRLTLAIAFAIVCLFFFIKIAHEMTEAETLDFDRRIIAFFQAHQGPPFHAVMTAISWLAGPLCQGIVVALSILGFSLRRRFFPDGLAMLIAGVGGVGLIVGLKALFHRPRPEEIFAHLGYSFPSGHSFFALVVYGMLAYWLTRDMSRLRRRIAWIIALSAIALVGFSRVFLGEHYPSDVAAGFAVAVPWLWGCLALPTLFHREGRDLSTNEAAATVQEDVK